MSLAKKHEYEAKKKGLVRDPNCPICQGTGKYWHKKWRRFAIHNKCFTEKTNTI